MNCLETKIEKASGPLKPTILSAILKLYKKGKLQISAKELKEECSVLDSTKDWNGRLAAICNGMRNVIDCGWRIITEDRDFNGFTISKNENQDSLNDLLEKKSVERVIIKEKKLKSNSTSKTSIQNIGKLDWSKIKDKKRKKLLIIGCSSTKIPGGQNIQNNHFSALKVERNQLLKLYSDLLNSPTPKNYFNKVRKGKGKVDNAYFKDQINNLFMPAVERYSGGDFYKPLHKALYYQKHQESNLHVLIISGLFGLLEFRDSIYDYQLEIKKFNFWNSLNNTAIRDEVTKYIIENKIDNNLVFYSLSPKNYKQALKPDHAWHDLWKTIPDGRSVNSKNSAKYLVEEFLPNL